MYFILHTPTRKTVTDDGLNGVLRAHCHIRHFIFCGSCRVDSFSHPTWHFLRTEDTEFMFYAVLLHQDRDIRIRAQAVKDLPLRQEHEGAIFPPDWVIRVHKTQLECTNACDARRSSAGEAGDPCRLNLLPSISGKRMFLSNVSL